MMFAKVLVANRGEIACRIIRTCRRMGIATIAVHSEADRAALHVELADQSLLIGPAPARESYLRVEAIIGAALNTGADAVHPGYGFLSENAVLAEACAEAGIKFVGPSPKVIRQMSLKEEAKAIAAAAGVPVLPGAIGEGDRKELQAAVTAMGFPVLVKAIAGGGGKGMRRVDNEASLDRAIASARREAESAFGDSRVMVEKFVPRARHIEVQIFGDAHGNAVHLFDRDCSVQRRHQKLVEEAPAPGIPDEMRSAMAEAALRLVRMTGYSGAGTVEFIADVRDGPRADRFWFLEMNTRLQVEHPVTEAITDLDLVEWQLRVAAGERLPLTQEQIKAAGHAIEVRLCAEDPTRMFLPSPGTITELYLPGDVRVESGVRAGDEVTPWYDSLLAKLVVHGSDRSDALARMADVLSRARIKGVITNLGLQRLILDDPGFVKADLDTALIERLRDSIAQLAA